MTFPEGQPFIPDEKDNTPPCQKSAEHMEKLAQKTENKNDKDA